MCEAELWNGVTAPGSGDDDGADWPSSPSDCEFETHVPDGMSIEGGEDNKDWLPPTFTTTMLPLTTGQLQEVGPSTIHMHAMHTTDKATEWPTTVM